jgi:hypothetical protein
MLRKNQPHRVRARQQSALDRRKAAVIVHTRVLADKGAPQGERDESTSKLAKAQKDIVILQSKLAIQS